MLSVTRWAGRHPLFVRVVLLPILFYVQGRLAFDAGARLFFDGTTLPDYWVWSMVVISLLATFLYPANPRALLHTHYWRVKGLEWIACMVGVGLWVYIGNQTARQCEGIPVSSSSSISVMAASVMASEGDSPEVAGKEENRLKKAYRNYLKAAVKRIKDNRSDRRIPLGVIILVATLGIGLGTVFLLCGINCGGSSGAVAFILIGGLFIALGLGVIIAGISRNARSASSKK